MSARCSSVFIASKCFRRAHKTMCRTSSWVQRWWSLRLILCSCRLNHLSLRSIQSVNISGPTMKWMERSSCSFVTRKSIKVLITLITASMKLSMSLRMNSTCSLIRTVRSITNLLRCRSNSDLKQCFHLNQPLNQLKDSRLWSTQTHR